MDQKLYYRAPFLRAKLPSECKNSTTLNELKTKINNWKGGKICPCRLCNDCLPDMDASDMIEVQNVSYSLKHFAQINIKNKNFTPFFMSYSSLKSNVSGLYRSSNLGVFFLIDFYDFCRIMTRGEEYLHHCFWNIFQWLFLR